MNIKQILNIPCDKTVLVNYPSEQDGNDSFEDCYGTRATPVFALYYDRDLDDDTVGLYLIDAEGIGDIEQFENYMIVPIRYCPLCGKRMTAWAPYRTADFAVYKCSCGNRITEKVD